MTHQHCYAFYSAICWSQWKLVSVPFWVPTLSLGSTVLNGSVDDSSRKTRIKHSQSVYISLIITHSSYWTSSSRDMPIRIFWGWSPITILGSCIFRLWYRSPDQPLVQRSTNTNQEVLLTLAIHVSGTFVILNDMISVLLLCHQYMLYAWN